MAHILVVDDYLDTCRVMARLLRRVGYGAECAGSGRAALDYLHAQPVDLVLLDISMPGMDGMEVLARMRADARLRAVPVVMYSALTDERQQEEARRLGAQDYIVKGRLTFDGIQEVIGKYATPN